MKLKSRAYVVTMETILPGINSVRIDDESGVSHEVNGQSKDLESALFMCNALNEWRENYAQGCIDQTISLMEEINDEVRTKAIAGS